MLSYQDFHVFANESYLLPFRKFHVVYEHLYVFVHDVVTLFHKNFHKFFLNFQGSHLIDDSVRIQPLDISVDVTDWAQPVGSISQLISCLSLQILLLVHFRQLFPNSLGIVFIHK